MVDRKDPQPPDLELVWIPAKEYNASLGGSLEDVGSATSGEEQTDYPLTIINNGIHLRQKDETQPFALFSYALAPFLPAPVHIDWKIISIQSIVGQHILCHHLKPGENLEDIVSSCETDTTRALILVNSEPNFVLPGVLQWRQTPSYPICVMQCQEGKQLLEMLQRFEVGEVLACVQSVSMTEAEAKRALSPVEDSSLSLSLELAAGTSKRRIRLPFQKPRVDLKKRIKEIMMSPTSGPLCVSDSTELFQQVMQEFNGYEQAALNKPHAVSDNGRVFQKLLKFIAQEGVFQKDAAFYILLAYRVVRKKMVYQCEELVQFIQKCIIQFEELTTQKKLDSMLKFIERGDFDIHYESDFANSGVFHLLEKACIFLMKESQKMKQRAVKSSSQHHSLLCRMIWLSLSLKFRSEVGSQDGSKLWLDHLTKDPSCFCMDGQAISDLVYGLEIGLELKLPVNSRFGAEQMSQLLASADVVRPFCQLSEFLKKVEPFLHVPKDFLEFFVVKLREPYRLCLESSKKKLSSLSTYQNLLGAIQEGLEFLDCMYEIWKKKRWASPEFDKEMLEWIYLLLGAVDITSDKAMTYLKEFVSSSSEDKVTKKYSKQIAKRIVDKTKKSFSSLNILKFCRLYTSFYIWPLDVVGDYFQVLGVPSKINLNDGVWVEFFREVVQRFPGAHNHTFILEFFIVMADKYLEEKKPKDFIVDLLNMNIPYLFAVEKGSGHESKCVPITFQTFLKEYIQRNNLIPAVIAHVSTVWRSLTQLSDFQLLVLSVLHKELIPESRSLQAPIKPSVNLILTDTIGLLCHDTSWLTDLSSHHKFAFGVVSVCCAHLPVSSTLDWASSYCQVIKKLSSVYLKYCQAKGLLGDERCLSEVPEDVASCSLDTIHSYFHWILQVQSVMKDWKLRFSKKMLNFDEIQEYSRLSTVLHEVAVAVGAEALIVDSHEVDLCKNEYLQLFEKLNVHLIRYIPGHPEAGWLPLTHLLQEYGIEIPEKVATPIFQQVVFPNEDSTSFVGLLAHPLPPSVTGVFNPAHDVALQLTVDVTLHQISLLVADLDELLYPVLDNLDLLIYFFLHKSTIFDTYLRYHLQKHGAVDSDALIGASATGTLLSSMRRGSKPFKGMSWKALTEALLETKQVILKLIEGTAHFTEITAGGTLALDQIDVHLEFKVLLHYTKYMDMKIENNDGLRGVQCMLELFQYLHHVQCIYSVCKQYHLEGCLADRRLVEVKDIADSLQEVTCRDQLTPKEAISMMDKLVKFLCLKKEAVGYNKHCLQLFPAVADSVMFYQFIKNNEFYGDSGQEVFYQKYELITAQLQHEEYNEVVLNHLYTAFKVMSPFMDDTQDFETLMMQVNEMTITSGRQELETVNRNIHLVRLWFSRTEEDTLEMVPSELVSILSTGEYQFEFGVTSSGVRAQLFLEYQPSAVSQSQMPVIVSDGQVVSDLSEARGEESKKHATLSQKEVLAMSEKLTLTSSLREAFSTPSTSGAPLRTQRWNSAQIRDFEQKLGFLDPDEKVHKNIQKFLMLNQNAYKLADLFQQLRDLGHPSYATEETTTHKVAFRAPKDANQETAVLFFAMPCASTDEDVLKKVKETEEKLRLWSLEVADLQSHYNNLLFFSIPKLLTVHNFMKENQVEEVVNEISFMFKNNPIVKGKLKINVKKLLPHVKSTLESSPAMETVGSFLHKLITEHEMDKYALKVRHPHRQLSRSISSQASTVLNLCHSLPSSQLLSLIINSYSGVPESFQLLRCQPSTTEEELHLFLKRVDQHPFQYMVIGVEKLRYDLQEFVLQYQLKTQPSAVAGVESGSCLHFVETGPSILREMPWILVKEHKDETALSYERAKKICRQSVVTANEDFQCITLVYGNAGDGKTHFIKNRLQKRMEHMVLQISINESFSPLAAIKRLQKLPTDTRGCCVYFNFTLLPPAETSAKVEERLQYKQLMDSVNWFFFDLLILGYVEDSATGSSFRLPGGLSWGIFVEVPSRGGIDPQLALELFLNDVPSLGLVGNKEYIDPRHPYEIDSDVQLVCKYLKAYDIGGKHGIDKQYKETRKGQGDPVKFSLDSDLKSEECSRLLMKYIPLHLKENKTTQTLFVRYMKRRCHFLDNLPAYNYNTGVAELIVNTKGKKVHTNTQHLGSTLMRAFLKEVKEFCHPKAQANWSKNPHQQLIYDCVDGGASIGLISLRADELPDEDKRSFEEIGIQLPSLMDLHSRELLDDFLSRALSVPLDDTGRLGIIDDNDYVLTLDYTLKMLNIHERCECDMPVVIEGETGVGKTALVEMLSKLWNSAHLSQWKKSREHIIELTHKKIEIILDSPTEEKQLCIDALSRLSEGKSVTVEDIQRIAELPYPHGTSSNLYSVLLKEALKLKDNPVLSLLELSKPIGTLQDFSSVFKRAQKSNSLKATCELLFAIFTAQVKNTFHKLNVHAALKPADIKTFFDDVSDQAYEIQDAFKKCATSERLVKVPKVTVFLDEVNTASCLGLFKEIMVDGSIDGMSLPDNIFVIAACNPHRGDSLAPLASKESWVRSNYYVRVLHPTLDMFKWDCGALDESQERDYINAKLKIINQKDQQQISLAELASLAELIVTSQNLMREFSYAQLLASGVAEFDAKVCSQSCVSQRDIQRVFTFRNWLMKVYSRLQPHGQNEDYHHCAVLVSLAIVYYLRLDLDYRQKYSEVMDNSVHPAGGLTFTECFQRELEWYIDQMDLPRGIAKTQALKENIFTNIVCAMTRTPLIIVGPPGCSKTLSFNLVTSNLRGAESKVGLFRDNELFQSLDPHYYQCSRRTTSNEVQTVFLRAINRQRSYAKVPLPIYCVVFMDEAGLPEESLESLKVLHYHLDRKEVSFVAISNHMLDAAKTNRAVSLYRPEASVDELRTLAKGCLCDDPYHPPAEFKKDIDIVVKFCPVYHKLMERAELKKFYGLRDFIHFVKYLRRNRRKGITEKLVMHALERNFNGHGQFENICKEFLSVMGSSIPKQRRSILDILKESLSDKPQDFKGENEVRYKLIIDSSEDSSLLRLLFAFGVLKERDTRTYVCSDFPGDTRQQMVNTIASIRHSASAGHTVIMSQTDEIHESFYDLFNQRFRRISDPKTGPRFYSNISIGAHHKPCRVHPKFQCIVVVKSSEVDSIPPPFLNRFEKYSLTHKILLEAVQSNLPDYLRAVMQRAQDKALEFINHVGGLSSLYGFREDTLDSLLLSLLPPVGFSEFIETESKPVDESYSEKDPKLFLLEFLLQALRKRAGFRIPHFTAGELEGDVDYVMKVVARDSQFDGQLQNLSCEDVLQAVPEALEALYHSHGKGSRTNLSISACMVISAFLQWLIRHLCKRLLQLMTTDALTTRYKTLPLSYTESYLQHQSHFNLKALIDKQLKVLELDDRTDRSTTGTANRLLVFTHSSAVIHQLPSRYPSRNSSNQSRDFDPLIRKLLHILPGVVVIYKLSAGSSQTTVSETLDNFVKARYKRVLLLVANMEETSPEIISHLRVMIEEADISQKNDKLFVLLLHFQSSVSYKQCYPALFSNTWDHHYMDIIGQSNVHEVFDICEWFSHCCVYLASCRAPQEPISMHLTSLLQEAIPTVSSRVFFGKNSSSSFNTDMEVPRRNVALQKLFETGVGAILCKKFLKYWEPNVMLEYLEKAASVVTMNPSSALSITESVQNILKDTFFDYVVYMVSKMNEDMNIDIIFDHDCREPVRALFLQLLEAYPAPKLSQLKSLSGFEKCISNVEASQKSSFVPKFPFYRLVSSAMEKIIEQTRKEINQRLDTLHEHPETSLSALSISAMPKVIEDKSHLVTAMQETVHFRLTQLLESSSQGPLKIAIQAMLENKQLWKSYNEAFTHQKLRLGTSSAGISFRILKLILTQLHDEQDVLTRFALLHICVYVYQLDLARLVQILRPLDNLLDMAANVPHDPFAAVSSPSPTSSFLSSLKQSGEILGESGDLSVYVLDILFSALVGCVFGENQFVVQSPGASHVQDNMKLWYHVYRDVMSVTAVKENLYKLTSEICETRRNIMHATFLVLQSSPSLNFEALANAQKVFTSLFNRHLSEKLEITQKGPNLSETAESIMQIVFGFTAGDAILQSSSHVRHLYEGLFSHFFSTHRTNYNSSDCQWFLEVANKNTHWIVKPKERSSAIADIQREYGRTRLSVATTANIGCVPVSVYKLYLTRILGKADVGTTGFTTSKSLTLYKPWVRNLVGGVLASHHSEEVPDLYVPTYYYHIVPDHKIAENESSVMQQPLAHLYFLTVLEHILSNKFNLPTIVRVSNAVTTDLEDDDTPRQQQILLNIEQQALVQAAIQLLARNLNPADQAGVSAVANIANDVNILLMKGITEGHGLVLVMHLLKELQSYNKFDELIGPSSIVSFKNDFACLKSLDTTVQLSNEFHCFTFLLSTGKNNILKELYERVNRAMQIVHTSHGRKRQPLATVAQEWSQGHVVITLPDGHEVQAERSCLFKMVLWLVTYNRFYCMKKTSPMLVDTLRTDLWYVVQPENVNNLFCRFLDPKTMEQEPSIASDIDFIPSFSSDPIYALFNPEVREEDTTKTSLRHALANLIAVVVAAPATTTHLWYHMFSADQLFNTYVPGFMYDFPVGRNETFYDSGAQLSPQGFFSQLSHMKHSTRGTLSLQSLYLLLWANFGACCIGLLADSGAVSKMRGKIFSQSLPVRQYCMMQLKTLWNHLSSSLGISVEERSLLVSRSMWNFLKLAISTSGIHCGPITTMSQLNTYEENWHTNVFTPAWKNLQQDFAKQSELYSNNILCSIRMLSSHYPCFATEKGLLQVLLADRSICDNVGNSNYILAQYAMLRKQLETIGALLPDLVEFYQWLHQELAHVITQEDAARITLRRAVRVLVRSYSAEEGERLQNLYRRLKDTYNSYASVCDQSLQVLEDNTSLIHVLSCSSDSNESQDILYTAISHVVTTHNDFIMKAWSKVQSDPLSPLGRYLSEDFTRVHPTEFTDKNCIIENVPSLHGLTEFDQLIRSHTYLPSATSQDRSCHTNLPCCEHGLVDLHQLQEDVFIAHVVGKPLIEPPISVRINFSFRDDGPHSNEKLTAIDADLLIISEKLYKEFKCPMDDAQQKSLELQFHSSGYHVIMETISGLRAVAGHLVKKLMVTESIDDIGNLHSQTVCEFLLSVFELNGEDAVKSVMSSRSILREIGVQSLSRNQFKALESIKLQNLYDVLKWFVVWASQGWFEFCSLPYSMKRSLNAPDQEALENLPRAYTDCHNQLMKDLKALVSVLDHFESTAQLAKTAAKEPQMPIVDLLSRLGECKEQEQLLHLIPYSIQIQHYVSFRVTLKRLMISLQRELSVESSVRLRTPQKWEDFVDDLWSSKLTQFRRDDYTYAVLTTGDQKRVYSLQNIDRDDEELLNDLMKAGISEGDLLPDTDVESLAKSESGSPLMMKSLSDECLDSPPSTSSGLEPMMAQKRMKLAERYTCEQVCEFLCSIGMDAYVREFQEFSITGDVLLKAGQGQGLIDLGVTNAVHRLKISILFQRHLDGVSKVAKWYPVDEVVRFLHCTKMSEYAESFLENQIDGECLLEASDEALEALGVHKLIHRLSIKCHFKKFTTPRHTTL